MNAQRWLPLLVAGIVWASPTLPAPAQQAARIDVAPAAPECVLYGADILGKAIQDRPEGTAGLRILVGEPGADEEIAGLVREGKVPAPQGPESFVIAKLVSPAGRMIVAAGGDAVGAMYGALELADQRERAKPGADFFRAVSAMKEKPFLSFRAVNPFLHVEAFADRNSWYFDESYWKGYLDLLARSRINTLDMHAMYGLVSTDFPNALPYLVKVDNYPEVGVSAEQAQENLRALQTIIRLAKQRGIRVGLMVYKGPWGIPPNPKPPYEQTEEALADYTREAVAALLKACPDLHLIGFRIGESAKPEQFYRDTYVRAIADAGSSASLYTRSWLASRFRIMDIFRAFPGQSYVEIKYNGEQLGAPYQVAGPFMGREHSYSYQSYTDFPRNYHIIWQVRANGTHRIFKWGDPQFVRRCVRSFKMGDSPGFTLEPMTAYYPQNDYIHSSKVHHDYFKWMFQRDWYWNMLWGRLSYDPDTPDEVFLAEFRRRFGEAGPAVFEAFAEASKVVPLIYSAYCLGPDHRDMAPELETGGDLNQFTRVGPFDDLSIESVAAHVDDLLTGTPSGRMPSPQVAELAWRHSTQALKLAKPAERIMSKRPASDPGRKEFECLEMDWEALSHLAGYYHHKLNAATDLLLFRKAGHGPDLDQALKETLEAVQEWQRLAQVTAIHYRPFLDTLRMHTTEFHWAKELPKLEADLKIMESERNSFREARLGAARAPVIGHVPVWRAAPGHALRIEASVLGQVSPAVRLRYRSAGETEFRSLEMRTDDFTVYAAAIPADRVRPGLLQYYIEAAVDGQMTSWPTGGRHQQVFVTSDGDAPGISDLRVAHAPRTRVAEVTVRVSDASGVRWVKLWHKPMPSEARWESDYMKKEGDVWRFLLPVTPEGALLYVESADKVGNASQHPFFLNETPYVAINPWEEK